MKIAVVILNWNGEKLLAQFLPAIIAYSKEADIYVADNASTDDSINFINHHYPTIKIIQNDSNGGYANGYNKALQAVCADVYALVNSDIEVTENWLQPIIQEFKKNETTSIIQPKILDYKKKTHFEYAGAGGGFIDKYGYAYCRGRIFNTLEKDNNQYNDIATIFWASGACFFIKAKVFHELNGFDADFFAHQEEIDLCWRAFNKNHQTKYVGTSVVYHVGGATLQSNSPQKTYLNFRNNLFLLVKNIPNNKLFPIMFFRMILDGIAGIQFLFSLKPMHTLAVFKAHFSFYLGFKKMYKKRGNTPKRKDYHHSKSMVWNYFVKGKKQFNSLN